MTLKIFLVIFGASNVLLFFVNLEAWSDSRRRKFEMPLRYASANGELTVDLQIWGFGERSQH